MYEESSTCVKCGLKKLDTFKLRLFYLNGLHFARLFHISLQFCIAIGKERQALTF